MSKQQKYGFLTAISMVIGIVVGCGIEYKVYDVLVAVNGNVLLGVLGFLIVGIGVLFGALAISEYAIQDDEYTGVIGYSKKALGDKFAFCVGWFAMTCYYPACIVVLAAATSIFLGSLLGVSSPIFITVATLVFLVASFTINIISPKSGGNIQIIFTVIKLIPLIVMGGIGTLFFTGTTHDVVASSTTAASSAGVLTSLIAIAFAFDGWIVATNIARELRGDQKTLSRALAIGTSIIIVIYVLYFFGITQILGPDKIIELGYDHTKVAAETLMGPLGGSILTIFVVISVYGGLNGLVLAYLRIPRNFSDSGLIKDTFIDKGDIITRRSIITCISFVAFYYIFQQLLDYHILFANLTDIGKAFDLSVLPIMTNYIFYAVLFVMVNKLVADKAPGKRIYFLIISVIATLVAFLVVYGTLPINGFLYIVFSIIILLLGIPFYKKQAN